MGGRFYKEERQRTVTSDKNRNDKTVNLGEIRVSNSHWSFTTLDER